MSDAEGDGGRILIQDHLRIWLEPLDPDLRGIEAEQARSWCVENTWEESITAPTEYVQADVLRELVAAVQKLEDDGWWAASECRFHAVRDAFAKAKVVLSDE